MEIQQLRPLNLRNRQHPCLGAQRRHPSRSKLVGSLVPVPPRHHSHNRHPASSVPVPLRRNHSRHLISLGQRRNSHSRLAACLDRRLLPNHNRQVGFLVQRSRNNRHSRQVVFLVQRSRNNRHNRQVVFLARLSRNSRRSRQVVFSAQHRCSSRRSRQAVFLVQHRCSSRRSRQVVFLAQRRCSSQRKLGGCLEALCSSSSSSSNTNSNNNNSNSNKLSRTQVGSLEAAQWLKAPGKPGGYLAEPGPVSCEHRTFRLMFASPELTLR